MSETEKPGKIKGLLSNGVMTFNLLLVVAILYQTPGIIRSFGSTSSDEARPAAADTGQERPKRTRDPSAHLPLKGMPDFEGDDEDACLRVEGFLLDMDYQLAKADLNSRVPIQDAISVIKSGQCGIEVPEIARAIEGLNKARVAVGLAELPPKP